MERQEFINRCNGIFNSWCVDNFQSQIEKLLDRGEINLEKVEDSYKDCFPAVAAVLMKVVRSCVNGSVYEDVRRKQKREANRYLKSI